VKYKLRGLYSKHPEKALSDILISRGVNDIKNFTKPSRFYCDLNPYNLNNIDLAAEKLL